MKVIGFLHFCLVVSPLSGQHLSPKQADSIRQILPAKHTDDNRIRMLFNLAEYYILKPGELEIDFDSSRNCLKQISELNQKLNSKELAGYVLLWEANILKERNEKEKGKEMMRKAIALLEQGSNKLYLAKGYYDFSYFYENYLEKQRDTMTQLVEKAKTTYMIGGDREGRAMSLWRLGDLYSITDDDERSLEALKESANLYDSIGFRKIHGLYALMGRLYSQQGDYIKGLNYELKALYLGDSLQDKTMQMCQIHNLLAGIYENLGSLDQSLKHYKAAIEVAMRFDDRFTASLLNFFIVYIYADLNQPQACLDYLKSQTSLLASSDNMQIEALNKLSFLNAYLSSKNYSMAEPYSEQLLKIVAMSEKNKANNEDLYWTSIRDDINRTNIRYYIAIGEIKKASQYLEINKKRIIGVTNPMVIAENAGLSYKLDSLRGDFKSAFHHLLVYHNITDSLYQTTKSRQYQLLQVEFDTRKKEDSIRVASQNIFLLTQKNDQQNAHLREVLRVRNVIMAGTALTLIILFLLYRQYRIKQKNNQIITGKNEQLQHLLTEKEWLLKEIHHRVKNNLQVVMSILNTQSSFIDNDVALAAIQTSQDRVHSMSLIHQKLYNSDNLSTIDMPSYIRELVLYLSDTYSVGQRIRFEFNLDPLALDVSQAIPLGLILNEAITNSIKYAFPGNRKGLIEIALSQQVGHKYILSIQDNGIGLPSEFHVKKSGSLGMSLMSGLSGDLDGTFTVENNQGTLIKIIFIREIPVVPGDPTSTQPALAMS